MIWENALSKRSPEVIRSAFIEHLKAGQYFPKPAEILARIGQWHTQRRASEQQQEMDAARWSREQMRAEGQPAGVDQLAGLMKRLVEVTQKWPEPLPTMRRIELKEGLASASAEREASKHAVMAEKAKVPEVRTASFTTPALDLSPEQIQARREAEREEIRKFQERVD